MIRLFQKIILILIVNFATLLPQSFGFGCFGFVGGYAGYGYQKYQPGSFDESIQAFNNSVSNGTVKIIPDFGNAYGYRLGINFFRAKFSKVFFSLKGYYELLSENHTYSYIKDGSNINSELDFSIKSWNVGFDFGIPITNLISWKIIDGTVHFNSARLSHKPNLQDNTLDIKFNNDSPELGYSIGTGFVFMIIENFASIEGTGGYSFFKINKMTNDDGSEFILISDNTKATNNDFIKAGGFYAVVQLNIGFPL